MKKFVSSGLVVHAAADGIALGAASLTDKTEIEFIIFLAIMLHKAPAAFGLTSFLLHEVLPIVLSFTSFKQGQLVWACGC